MLSPLDVKPRSSGGKGGLWGKIAGGLAGGIAAAAAPVTGGASLAAIPAAMGAGSMIGGTIGGAIDPEKISERNPLQTLGNSDPGVMLAQLGEASKAALTLPETEARPLLDSFDRTRNLLKQRIG